MSSLRTGSRTDKITFLVSSSVTIKLLCISLLVARSHLSFGLGVKLEDVGMTLYIKEKHGSKLEINTEHVLRRLCSLCSTAGTLG